MRLIDRWKGLKVQVKTATVLALIVFVSLISDEKSWGFNYLWFLPDAAVLLILALSGWLIFVSIRRSGKEIAKRKSSGQSMVVPPWAIHVLLPLITLIVILVFPLFTDAYGDTSTITTKYHDFFGIRSSQVESILPLIDLDIFNLHNGERFTFNAVRLIKDFTRFSLEDSFKVYGVLLGVLSAFVYSLYTRLINQSSLWLPIVFFISLNSILVISGHIEVYAPSLFFLLLFIYVGRLHFQVNTNRTALFLTIALFFAIKSHFVHFVLLAPYAYLILLRFKSGLFNYLTFRNVIVIFCSGFLGFVLAYFFVFENHDSHYALSGDELSSNVFLPLFAPEPPYDHYSLLNVNHLVDMGNLILFWSPVLIVALFAAFSYRTDQLFMPDNYFLILVFGLFGYLAISFVLNPLLSFPRDWDLLSIGSPFLLAWITELWYAQASVFRIKVAPQLFAAFLLFTVPRTIVESQPHQSGLKQLSLGLHVFNTYYAGSSVILSKGIKQLEAKEEDFIADLINELLDRSQATPDLELCHFISQAGFWYTDRFNDVNKSVVLFQQAIELYPDYEIALKGLAMSLQKQGDMKGALTPLARLINLKPDNREYLKLAINSFYSLKMRPELEKTAQHLIELFPDERDAVRKILERN